MVQEDRPARSASFPVKRIALATVTLAIGAIGTAFTVAQAVRQSDAALATSLASYDGSVLANDAAQRTYRNGSRPDPTARSLALRALASEPTAISAVTTLGLDAEWKRDVPTSRHLLNYAQRLTRRDVRMQLWSIETAVAQGDIAGALHWYDITLRTKPSMSDILFPVLAASITEPDIRRQLAGTLSAQPQWGGRFMSYLASNTESPPIAANLFTSLHQMRVPVPENARTDIINRLIAGGQLDMAWTFYRLYRPTAQRNGSRDPRFTQTSPHSSSLDWVPVNDNGVTTSIQDGMFEFSAPASVGGPLLRQTQLLSRGAYRLTGQAAGIDQDVGTRPYWALACVDGRELGRVSLTNSPDGPINFAGTFVVPAGCPVQILTLVGLPSGRVAGLSGRVEAAQLVPVQ